MILAVQVLYFILFNNHHLGFAIFMLFTIALSFNQYSIMIFRKNLNFNYSGRAKLCCGHAKRCSCRAGFYFHFPFRNSGDAVKIEILTTALELFIQNSELDFFHNVGYIANIQAILHSS